VLAPIAAAESGTKLSALEAIGYVFANSTTVITVPNLGSALLDSPSPAVWNASLWTLSHELFCYFLAGGIFGSRYVRNAPGRQAAAVFVFSTAIAWGATLAGLPRMGFWWPETVYLFPFFAAGALVAATRSQRPSSPPLVVGSCVALVGIGVIGLTPILAPLPLSIVLLRGMALLPVGGWGVPRDLSYGLYLYAFPVQQGLQLAVGHLHDPITFAVAAIVIGLALATLSSYLVERPAQRLARRRTSWQPSAGARPKPARVI
jgi:peptidoglycan/LPS O-acetylase OafA/YrhL